jgi:hypothetical protein
MHLGGGLACSPFTLVLFLTSTQVSKAQYDAPDLNTGQLVQRSTTTKMFRERQRLENGLEMRFFGHRLNMIFNDLKQKKLWGKKTLFQSKCQSREVKSKSDAPDLKLKGTQWKRREKRESNESKQKRLKVKNRVTPRTSGHKKNQKQKKALFFVVCLGGKWKGWLLKTGARI